MNVSKKLVETILEYKNITSIRLAGNNICIIRNNINCILRETHNVINIYEFAFKCKEWSTKLGYKIITVSDFDIRHDIVENYKDYYFTAFINMNLFPEINKKDFTHLHDVSCKTEPEAIFKACEWILDEIGN